MYDACREWMQAVRAKGDKFLGGDQPCLADLVSEPLQVFSVESSRLMKMTQVGLEAVIFSRYVTEIIYIKLMVTRTVEHFFQLW